jgi:hypothetical protein
VEKDFRNSSLEKGDKGGCKAYNEEESKKQPPPPPLLIKSKKGTVLFKRYLVVGVIRKISFSEKLGFDIIVNEIQNCFLEIKS